jgi:hypothetical protein
MNSVLCGEKLRDATGVQYSSHLQKNLCTLGSDHDNISKTSLASDSKQVEKLTNSIKQIISNI